METLPKHLKHYNQTLRGYKKRKRKEFRDAKEALKKLQYGCAFLPQSSYIQLNKAMASFEKAYLDCLQWWKKA